MQVVRMRVADNAYQVAHDEAQRITGVRYQSGNGLFSIAYVGNGVCAKVCHEVRDDGYLAWLKACAPIMGKNPHVPVVHKAIIFDDGEQQSGLYVMEVLRESNHWGREDGRERAGDKFAKLFRNIVICGSDRAPEALREVAAIVNNLRDNWSVDLHGGNVMLRGTRWVITDPISFRA